MSLHMQCDLVLPAWVETFIEGWPQALQSDEERMRLAIALSARNVKHKTGGPFGAIVVEKHSGRLIGAGVNLVTSLGLSIAHAEMVALSLAQRAVRNWNLGAKVDVELVTSCEPCAMCFGAVPWSGVTSLIAGARKEDAEAAGFDEGDKPSDWMATLEKRGIKTRANVLREEAAAVLLKYARREGAIYHPGRE